ncbi:unnamed protein product [Orchesella dallaii]|uniref:C2H2-type domain-containing protein n=1 Tax=Orchesella dallaii TaxID=48710 RepID=A0ABP1RVN7_9HEXA
MEVMEEVEVKEEPLSEPESEEEDQDFQGDNNDSNDDDDEEDDVIRSFSAVSKQTRTRELWKNQQAAKRRRATEEQLEERRRKDRERKRLWRLQLKEQREASKSETETKSNQQRPSRKVKAKVKIEKEDEDDEDNEQENEDKEGEGKKKKVRECKVKTKEDLRERWRADQRRRRQRLREQMTDAEIEEQKRKDRERARVRRAKLMSGIGVKIKKKEGSEASVDVGDNAGSSNSNYTIVNIEALRAKWRVEARERRKRRKENMTEEQLQEARQKRSLQRLEKKINMTDEEKKLEKTKRYLAYLEKQATLPEEELERRKRKRAEYAKKLRRERLKACPITDEDRAKKREEYRKWRQNMTPEKLARYREKCRINTMKVLARMRQDPEKWKEKRRRMTENDTRRRREKRLAEGKTLRKKRRKGSPVPPNSEAEKKDKKRRIRKNLTDGISKRARNIKCCRDRLAKETPDQRMKRLMAQRFRLAKRTLRKKLTAQGKSFEEIEREMEHLEKTWRPSNRFLKPHARPKLRDPQVERELELLARRKMENEEEEKPELENMIINSEQPSTSRAITEAAFTSPLTEGVELPIKTDPVPPSTLGVKVVGHPVDPPHPHQEAQIYPPPPPPAQPHLPQSDSRDHYFHPNISNYSLPFYGQPSSATPQQFDILMNNNVLHEGGSEEYSSSTIFDETEPASPLAPPSPMSTSDFEGFTQPPPPPLLPPPPSLFSAPPKQSEESNQLLNSNPQPQPKPKGKKPRKKYPTSSGLPRVGPRGVRSKTHGKYKQLAVCDICGHAYPPRYMLEHVRKLHHPNFDFETKCCTLCNAGPFPTCWQFHRSHWMVEHHLEQKAIMDGIKPFICEVCGASYKTKVGCDFHQYNVHGEGALSTVKCPFCSKELKNKLSLNSHIHRFHEEAVRKPCLRCDEKFRNLEELKEHVQKKHPDSYFPCERCGVMKYTLSTKLFHYENCRKKRRLGMTDEMRKERKESKKKAVNMMQMECEVCGARMRLDSLWRHYLDVHGVKEDKFTCLKEGCGKIFKQREYWVGHMEVLHEIDLETIKEEVSKFNKVDRSNVVILNSTGERCKFNRRSLRNKKMAFINMGDEEEGGGRKRRQKTKTKSDDEDDEEEEDKEHCDDDDDDSESNSEPNEKREGRRKLLRRKVVKKKEEEERVVGTRKSERMRRKPIKYQNNNDYGFDIEKDKRLVISIVPLQLTKSQYSFLSRRNRSNSVISSNSRKEEGEENEDEIFLETEECVAGVESEVAPTTS